MTAEERARYHVVSAAEIEADLLRHEPRVFVLQDRYLTRQGRIPQKEAICRMVSGSRFAKTDTLLFAQSAMYQYMCIVPNRESCCVGRRIASLRSPEDIAKEAYSQIRLLSAESLS